MYGFNTATNTRLFKPLRDLFRLEHGTIIDKNSPSIDHRHIGGNAFIILAPVDSAVIVILRAQLRSPLHRAETAKRRISKKNDYYHCKNLVAVQPSFDLCDNENHH